MKPNKRLRTCFIAACLHLAVVFPGGFSMASAQGTLDRNEIKAAVETWVREWTPHARPDAIVESLEPYVKDNETCAYIARLSSKGYCLCGGDPLVLPVYLYCPEGSYDPRNPGCQ